MRTIKGFITRDGEHVNLPSGGNVVEEYTDDEASFRNSDVIGTILVAGIHQVLYKKEGTTVETNHFLLVRHFTTTHPVTHITRYAVEQCVIDESGIFKRSRTYNNEEHTDPYSEWTAWDNIIPSVTNNITEDSYDAITSGAVYTALAGKAGIYTGTLRVDSAGDNSYPIPEDGIVQTALDSFVESAEQDKMYNVLVQFATQYSFTNFYPAIVYWTIDSQDNTVVHIYVGDYHFVATKAEGATAWANEKFGRSKISSFLETF